MKLTILILAVVFSKKAFANLVINNEEAFTFLKFSTKAQSRSWPSVEVFLQDLYESYPRAFRVYSLAFRFAQANKTPNSWLKISYHEKKSGFREGIATSSAINLVSRATQVSNLHAAAAIWAIDPCFQQRRPFIAYIINNCQLSYLYQKFSVSKEHYFSQFQSALVVEQIFNHHGIYLQAAPESLLSTDFIFKALADFGTSPASLSPSLQGASFVFGDGDELPKFYWEYAAFFFNQLAYNGEGKSCLTLKNELENQSPFFTTASYL